MHRSDTRSIASRAVLIFTLVPTMIACQLGPPPTSDDTPTALTVRGAYGRDSSASGTDVMRAAGITTVTASPSREVLDRLVTKGMRAIVWLGAYDRPPRTEPCAFEHDDAWIEQRLAAVAGHPGIAAYQIADEPDPSLGRCPDVVEEIANRASLIASIDDSAPTYVTITRNGATYERWASVDVLGLVVYPVSIKGYAESAIPEAIAGADADGVLSYWAVIQDFQTPSWYVIPTAVELQHEFDQWAISRMEGYMIYHWAQANLDDRPNHLAVIRAMNDRDI